MRMVPFSLTASILFALPLAHAGESAACARLLHPVVRGQAVLVTDLATVPCQDDSMQRVGMRYDRDAKVVRATRDMQAGDIVAAVPTAYLAQARRGDNVAVTWQEGAVTIKQEGIALTDGVQGQPLMVRTRDGRVLKVPTERRVSP